MSDPQNSNGTLLLLEQTNVTTIIKEIVRRKSTMFIGAIAGGILGLALGLLGPGGSEAVIGEVRDAHGSKYANQIAQDVFNPSRGDVMRTLQRSFNTVTLLPETAEEARSAPGNLFTWLPRKLLNAEKLRLKVEPVGTFKDVTQDNVERLKISLTGTHPSVSEELMRKIFVRVHEIAKVDFAAQRSLLIEASRDKVNSALENARSAYNLRIKAQLAKISEEQSQNIKEFNDKISAIRLELRLRRESRIRELQEAIQVAEATGLTKPSPLISGLAMSSSGSNSGSQDRGVPLMLLGSEALREELKVLSARSNDDHGDTRISEIQRDIELQKVSRTAEAIAARTQPDLFIENYSDIVQLLPLLDSLSKKKGDFEVMEVAQAPSRGDFSPAVYVLMSIIRGIFFGLLVMSLYLAFGFMLRQRA